MNKDVEKLTEIVAKQQIQIDRILQTLKDLAEIVKVINNR